MTGSKKDIDFYIIIVRQVWRFVLKFFPPSVWVYTEFQPKLVEMYPSR